MPYKKINKNITTLLLYLTMCKKRHGNRNQTLSPLLYSKA